MHHVCNEIINSKNGHTMYALKLKDAWQGCVEIININAERNEFSALLLFSKKNFIKPLTRTQSYVII